MIKSNTSHIGFEDTKCPLGVEAVTLGVDQITTYDVCGQLQCPAGSRITVKTLDSLNWANSSPKYAYRLVRFVVKTES